MAKALGYHRFTVAVSDFVFGHLMAEREAKGVPEAETARNALIAWAEARERRGMMPVRGKQRQDLLMKLPGKPKPLSGDAA